MLFTMTAIAAVFVVEGGFLYTSLDIESDIFYGVGEGIVVPSVNNANNDSNILSDFDSATGYFIGIGTDAYGFQFGLQYEKFSQEETGKQETETLVDEASAEIDITGYVLNIGRPINDYFSLSASAGRYNADMENEFVRRENAEVTSRETYIYDVESSYGYKIGATFNYSFSDNWSFISNANYRFLELDYEVVSPFFKIAKTQNYQQSKLWIISS